MINRYELRKQSNNQLIIDCNAFTEKQAVGYFYSFLRAFKPNHKSLKYSIKNKNNGHIINCGFDYIENVGNEYFKKLIKEGNL